MDSGHEQSAADLEIGCRGKVQSTLSERMQFELNIVEIWRCLEVELTNQNYLFSPKIEISLGIEIQHTLVLKW